MPDPIAALVKRLWTIKDGRSFGQMAEEAGIQKATLWRIMQGERRPSADTMAALLGTYPELAALFVSEKSPPSTAVVSDGAD